MTGQRAAALLDRPVLLHGIELGRLVDVVIDLDSMRAVGLEVECGDSSRRFLPLPAARMRPEAVEVASPLLLLGDDDLGFYRRRSRPLSALLGLPVERGRQELGQLVDVELGDEGTISAFLVTNGHSDPQRIAAESRLRVGGGGRSSRVER